MLQWKAIPHLEISLSLRKKHCVLFPTSLAALHGRNCEDARTIIGISEGEDSPRILDVVIGGFRKGKEGSS